MKRLKRVSKAAVSLCLSAVMTVLPAAGGMIAPAYGMELSENANETDSGNWDNSRAEASGQEQENQGGAAHGQEIGGGGENFLDQGSSSREPGEQGGSGQEPGDQGSLDQNQGNSGQESGNQDSSSQEPGDQGGSGQNPEDQDSSGQNQGDSSQNQENQSGSDQNQGSQTETGDSQVDHGSSGGSGAEETLPEETLPEETSTDNSHSGGISPEETLPEETLPEETGSDESHSGGIRPEETLPEETPEGETASGETQPTEETSPQETQPTESSQALQPQETTVPESTLNPELIPPETQAQKRMSQEDMTLSAEVGGILITVEAEAGILPEDTELAVKRIESAGDLEKISQAVERTREDGAEEYGEGQIYAFDISLYSGEEQIEPDDGVTITMRLPESVAAAENVRADLFHLDEQLEEAEQLEADLDGAAVTAPVSHFSPFVLMVAAAATADGYVEAGADVTVAQALEDLTAEEVSRAGGEVTLCLTGDTQDGNEVFIPRDKGITHITITGKDGEDYKIGKGADGTTLFANGVPLLLEHGKINNLYGGGKNIKLDSTDVTITGGQFLGDPGGVELIIVGGSLATEKGADVSVSGSCNILIEDNTTLEVGSIYGGCVLNAADATAKIGTTNVTVRDSSVLICMGCGGCFLWDRANNAVADVGETYINFENSEVQVGYFDFTFSIFGGHIGNNKVSNQVLRCGTTNITVEDTAVVMFGYGGADIFGGNYCVKDGGVPEVTLDRSIINLTNSQVNGVFGGGYYEENCFAKTGGVEINADGCQFGNSSVVDEKFSILYGGDLYQTKKDYGQTPEMGEVDITLTGGVTEGLMVRSEGVNQNNTTKTEEPILPAESHLTLDQTIRAQVDTLDLDSGWTDATVLFDDGKSTVIIDYADYADLIEQIRAAAPLPDPVEDPGTVEQKPTPEQVETPPVPEGSTVAPEEMETKKNAAVEEAIKAIADTAANNTVPSLNEAIKDLDGIKPGDQVSTYLKIDITDIILSAAAKDGDVSVVPQKLILDVTPVMKVIPSGTGEPQISPISNDQLDQDKKVEFLVGVPDSVTASMARVIHHAASGDETYDVKVEHGEDGKFLRLHANQFSAFEIEFLADAEPDVPQPDPQPDPGPQPSGSTHDSDGSGNSTAVEGRWVQDAKGWWYQYNNGTWPREQWAYLTYGDRYSWYFFDEDGYMKDGWVFWNGNWYYLHRSPDGTRGHMYVGWQQIEGKWYYFETDPGKNQGALYVNCKTPGGYTVGPDGSWTGETN